MCALRRGFEVMSLQSAHWTLYTACFCMPALHPWIHKCMNSCIIQRRNDEPSRVAEMA